jgi:PAS domain-containing protein
LPYPEDIGGIIGILSEVMQNRGLPVKAPAIRMRRHKSGDWHWYDATLANMMHDPAIGGIVDNFYDVTDKVLRDQEIKNNREQLQKIMDNSIDVICTIDKKGFFLNDEANRVKIYGAMNRKN